MNVNKKLDRLRQWGKERMGGEVKTDTSDDFKALETEMQLRHDGMESLKKSADVYVKSISKRDRYEDKELQLPVAYLGSAMTAHGDDFESQSEFGQCLTVLGRGNERIARLQETYSANATSSWLESLERSLLQAKELQAARKKLEGRRLAYDTAFAKWQKSKKEDPKMEEELRAQKVKYEESSEDVYRRMREIKEAETDSVLDLTTFLDAQLSYYDRCRDVLMHIKREWPASTSSSTPTTSTFNPSANSTNLATTTSSRSGTSSPVNGGLMRRLTRSRASSMTDRYSRLAEGEAVDAPSRPPRSRVPSGQNSPHRELPGFDFSARPTIHSRSFSFGGKQQQQQQQQAGGNPLDGVPLLARANTEAYPSTQARSGRLRSSTLRNEQQQQLEEDSRRVSTSDGDAFADKHTTELYDDDDDDDSSADDDDDDDDAASSIPAYAHERPSASFLSTHHANSNAQAAGGRRGLPRPPPPPSRSKKPPPPPPLKRSALSAGEVPRY